MDVQHERIAVLPRPVAAEVVTVATSWAGWAASLAVLVLTVPVLVDTFVERPSVLVTPLLCLAGMLVLLVTMAVRPSVYTRIAYLALGSVLVTIYIVSVIGADPDGVGAVAYLLNRPAFVLVLAAVAVRRPLRALVWSAVGFVAANLSIVAGDLIAGAPTNVGWGPVFALTVCALTFVTLAIVGGRKGRLDDDLRALEEVTSRLALEYQFEQRAAALIHDTVLNDLTVVMNSSGPISDKARERFRRDIIALDKSPWLRESRASVGADWADSALRNGISSLVSEMQWRGLSVNVTGTPESDIVCLTGERLEATLDAVRACLQNVVEHSGTTTAALVVGLTDDAITFMVIDEGRGFDPASIPGDRLGLRNSVIGRVEAAGGTVRVWSQPGSGTSVMTSMPADIVPHESDES